MYVIETDVTLVREYVREETLFSLALTTPVAMASRTEIEAAVLASWQETAVSKLNQRENVVHRSVVHVLCI